MKNRISNTHLKVLESQKITCQDVVRLQGDRVEGELSTTLKARVDAHVSCCEHCQNFDLSYRHIIGLAAELNDSPIPRDVQNRLRKSLNEKLGLSMAMV